MISLRIHCCFWATISTDFRRKVIIEIRDEIPIPQASWKPMSGNTQYLSFAELICAICHVI